MSKNLSHLSGRKGLQYNLFEELGISAGNNGTPDHQTMENLKNDFLFGKANVYGTVSFYDFLKQENRNKKIYICNGSSCLTAGTQELLKDEISKHFIEEEIGEMCCLGRCHENNSFHYNDQNYSGEAIQNLWNIIDKKVSVQDNYNVGHIGTRVIAEEITDIDAYYNLLKECLLKTPDDLLAELKISGLRGRGGAGFPTAFKLESCKNTNSNTKFIVSNADEGDPGAYSDRYILEHRPHTMLLGMLISGYITGAEWGVIYIRAEYPEAVRCISKAIKELDRLKLTGKNIANSNFNFFFKIIKAQGAYICGEETALLSSIEGQRPEVRIRPPFPSQQGLYTMPTVVSNVETLACIPYIIQHGGKKFAEIGVGKSTGTKLISLDGFFKRAGIYEVDFGTPLKNVIYDLGGGFNCPVKALHIGGPLGGLIPIHKIDDIFIDFESFSQHGFLLGHASIVCIPDTFPIIEYIKHLFKFTAHESCGKCFPCRLGSTRGYEMVENAMVSDIKIDIQLMDDLLETMELGSLCALGGGLPLPIKNALQYFEEELKPFFK
ncbi:MAG: NAD(P)H-dependent oxidoreductase subunit E [Saprospiraceae bacterium]|nr:NAD(P)H-dependent oxidoreductase subunit E [Saprospiraceae bacterium]